MMRVVSFYVMLAAMLSSVVFSAPIEPATSVTDFETFIKGLGDVDACIFPPLSVVNQDKFKPCLDKDVSGGTALICNGIMELSEKVCPLEEDLSMTIMDIIDNLKAGSITKDNVTKLCSGGEIQHELGDKEQCTEVCSEEKAYYPCELLLAMRRALYTRFKGLKTAHTVHRVIHNLPKFFPFPPHMSMDKGMYLEACEKDNESSVTVYLCSIIKKLAVLHGQKKLPALDTLAVMKNVTGDWKPCPAMEAPMNISSSDCESMCEDKPNDKICRTIALGIITMSPKAKPPGPSTTTKPKVTTQEDEPPAVEDKIKKDIANTSDKSAEEKEPKEPAVDSPVSPASDPNVKIPDSKPASGDKPNNTAEIVNSDAGPVLDKNIEKVTPVENKTVDTENSDTADGVPPESKDTPAQTDDTKDKPSSSNTNTDTSAVGKTGMSSQPPSVISAADAGDQKDPKLPDTHDIVIDESDQSKTNPGEKENEGDEEPTKEDNAPKENKLDEDNQPKENKLDEDNAPKEDKLDEDNAPKENKLDEDNAPKEDKLDEDNAPKENKLDEDNAPKENKLDEDNAPKENKLDEDNAAKESKLDEDNAPKENTIDEGSEPKENKLDGEKDKVQNENESNMANVYSDPDQVATGGMSFMSYFLVFLVLCVAGYIVFHNKQKIIALVIEGKSGSNGRRPSSKEYKRLKTDDVMPSLEKSANTSNYVY